jgi:hypothetical protein
MAESLNDLWHQEDSSTPQEQASEPVSGGPPPSPPAPAAPDRVEELNREVYQLRGLVGGLLNQRQTPPPAAAEPPTPTEWKDREFLGPDEGELILSGDIKQFPQRLNKLLNEAARSGYQLSAAEVQRVADENRRLQEQTQQQYAQQTQAAQQQQFRHEFYTAHPDLQGDEWLVGQATTQVAQQFAQQPWAAPPSPQGLMQVIGQTARQLKEQSKQRWAGGSQPEPPPAAGGALSPSPARRAQVETGGSTRVGTPPQPRDGQGKFIADMHKHVKG